jgi:hypothetical protein
LTPSHKISREAIPPDHGIQPVKFPLGHSP